MFRLQKAGAFAGIEEPTDDDCIVGSSVFNAYVPWSQRSPQDPHPSTLSLQDLNPTSFAQQCIDGLQLYHAQKRGRTDEEEEDLEEAYRQAALDPEWRRAAAAQDPASFDCFWGNAKEERCRSQPSKKPTRRKPPSASILRKRPSTSSRKTPSKSTRTSSLPIRMSTRASTSTTRPNYADDHNSSDSEFEEDDEEEDDAGSGDGEEEVEEEEEDWYNEVVHFDEHGGLPSGVSQGVWMEAGCPLPDMHGNLEIGGQVINPLL